MAISASTIWEVRGGSGADTNGGGFVEGASGTDRSQQNSAQATLSVLSLVHTTTTQINVSILDFTVSAADVGNILQITGGTATAGFYQITAVDVPNNRWTLDRSAGTSAQTVVGAMGGALNTISKAYSAAISLNRIYLKATANYTFTATITHGLFVEMIGYSSARTDFQSSSITGRATITTATNSTALFTFNASTGLIWRNIIFTNTAATRAVCISGGGVGIRGALFDRCKFDGFTQSISASAYSAAIYQRCEICNCTTANVGAVASPNNDAQPISFFDCYIHDNAGYGFDGGGNTGCISVRTIWDTNTAGDIRITASGTIGSTNTNMIFAAHSVFYGGGGAGIYFSSASANDNGLHVENNIFYGKAYGLRSAGSRVPYMVAGGVNAFGNNSTADRSGVPALAGDITLTADPFVDAANGDFTLNSTAGGGAALKGVALPTAALP